MNKIQSKYLMCNVYCLFIYLYICVSIYLYLFRYLLIYLFVYLFIYLFTYLFIYFHLSLHHVFIYLLFIIYMYLITYLFSFIYFLYVIFYIIILGNLHLRPTGYHECCGTEVYDYRTHTCCYDDYKIQTYANRTINRGGGEVGDSEEEKEEQEEEQEEQEEEVASLTLHRQHCCWGAGERGKYSFSFYRCLIL